MAEMERNRRGKASATRNGRRINKKTSAMKYDKIVAMNQEKSRKKVDVLKEK